jgi:hypothetical protein
MSTVQYYLREASDAECFEKRPRSATWQMGSNGYMIADGIQRMYDKMDGIQVKKVTTASQSKPGNVWI